MATYIKLKKLGIIKGTGKQNLDDLALAKLADGLDKSLTKLGYDFDGDVKAAAKQKTGFVVDGTITELFVNVMGTRAKIGAKCSMALSFLPASEAFGFLTSSGATEDSAKDKAVQDALVDVILDTAGKLATKIDLGIKDKQRP